MSAIEDENECLLDSDIYEEFKDAELSKDHPSVGGGCFLEYLSYPMLKERIQADPFYTCESANIIGLDFKGTQLSTVFFGTGCASP